MTARAVRRLLTPTREQDRWKSRTISSRSTKSEEETEFATIAGGATIEEAKRTALEQLRKVVP